jgi:uncharacterized protein YbjT (DUF2867 family)
MNYRRTIMARPFRTIKNGCRRHEAAVEMTRSECRQRLRRTEKRGNIMGQRTQRESDTVLVIGGTGKTGRRVAERLTERGWPVRIGSRSAEPPFDWNNWSTWAPALTGVAAAYITFAPDLAVPGSVDAVRLLSQLAVERGVQRVVLLSGRGEDEAQRAEQVVQQSGLAWTIVRASWFAQNFSEDYLLDAVLAGEVILPAGEIREPFVDAGDIADVVVAALTEPGHDGQVYEVTGPRLLTFAEAVEQIGAATRRDIRFTEVTPAAYAAMLAEQGVPGEYVWLLNYLFTTVLDGRNASLADGVRRALGREPRDFAAYAREGAANGVWNAPALAGVR